MLTNKTFCIYCKAELINTTAAYHAECYQLVIDYQEEVRLNLYRDAQENFMEITGLLHQELSILFEDYGSDDFGIIQEYWYENISDRLFHYISGVENTWPYSKCKNIYCFELTQGSICISHQEITLLHHELKSKFCDLCKNIMWRDFKDYVHYPSHYRCHWQMRSIVVLEILFHKLQNIPIYHQIKEYLVDINNAEFKKYSLIQKLLVIEEQYNQGLFVKDWDKEGYKNYMRDSYVDILY